MIVHLLQLYANFREVDHSADKQYFGTLLIFLLVEILVGLQFSWETYLNRARSLTGTNRFFKKAHVDLLDPTLVTEDLVVKRVRTLYKLELYLDFLSVWQSFQYFIHFLGHVSDCELSDDRSEIIDFD